MTLLCRCTCLFALFLLCLGPIAATAATIVVDVETDSAARGTECNLRTAIEAANMNISIAGCLSGSGPDEIIFAPGVNFILLEDDLPRVTDDLEVRGGETPVWIDGDDQYSMFYFDLGADGVLRNLVLFQGFNASGNSEASCLRTVDSDILLEDMRFEACENARAGRAPISISSATATVRRTTFVGNRGSRSALSASSFASFLVEDSTFRNNGNADSTIGALSVSSGSVIVRRTTFFGNRADQGAAISTCLTCSLRLEHSTVSGNVANATDAGAIDAQGTVTLFNSIVAGNTRDSGAQNPDLTLLSSASMVTEGHNLIGRNDGNFTAVTGAVADIFPAGLPNANSDFVGTGAMPLDAMLGPGQDNGGPTRTMLPGPMSVAVDGGSCADQSADQRGYVGLGGQRAVDDPGAANADDGCDIGAVELGALPQLLFSDGFESGDTAAWSP